MQANLVRMVEKKRTHMSQASEHNAILRVQTHITCSNMCISMWTVYVNVSHPSAHTSARRQYGWLKQSRQSNSRMVVCGVCVKSEGRHEGKTYLLTYKGQNRLIRGRIFIHNCAQSTWRIKKLRTTHHIYEGSWMGKPCNSVTLRMLASTGVECR